VWFVLTDQVGDGPWNATVTLRSGLNREAFRAQITFPHAPGTGPAAAAHPAGSGISIVTILISAILVVLLAALAALVIMAYRRRKHHKNHLGAASQAGEPR
jgi:heme/copper-type cytochrome/quinol oxidase subunit 2